MKSLERASLLTVVIALALGAGLSGCSKSPGDSAKPADAAKPSGATAKSDTAPVSLDSDDQKVSYGIGHNIGSNLSRQPGMKVDRDALVAGLEDALAGSEFRIPEGDIQSAFMAIEQRAAAAASKVAEENLAAGNAFLETNKARAGVTVTASGLQYEVLKSGDGAKPTATDRVEVHYHGTLVNGSVFDSSVERGEPASFGVNQVIPGWTEALQLMSVGDKWRIFLPAAIGYGPRAAGKIPPNSALIFEVELIAIK